MLRTIDEILIGQFRELCNSSRLATAFSSLGNPSAIAGIGLLLLCAFPPAVLLGCENDPAAPGNGDPVHAFSMGVALSPRGHTSGSTNQDWVDHFSGHAPWGRIIAFHTNWRDDLASAGQIPALALVADAAAKDYGFVPALGLGWAGGEGEPDLTSEPDTIDNSWSNQETRDEYLTMVTEVARLHQPPLLFLGNETNSYYRTHSVAEWESWLSVYSACYDSIKVLSPTTSVFTTFNYELVKGVGKNNGWTYPEDWQPVDDIVDTGRLDALGFTSYPYFEYDTPAEIPADYYEEISAHWSGPVIFTEIGWLGAQSPPYAGGEADQVQFISRFFDLSRHLELRYVVWLFLHDWDGQDAVPAFRFVGLRANDGTPRQADGAWQSEVVGRQ